MVVIRLLKNSGDYVIYRIFEEDEEERSYNIKFWKKDGKYEIEGVGNQAQNHYQAGAVRLIRKGIKENNLKKEAIEAWG